MCGRLACCLAGAATNTLTAAGARGWRCGRLPAPEYALDTAMILVRIEDD